MFILISILVFSAIFIYMFKFIEVQLIPQALQIPHF